MRQRKAYTREERRLMILQALAIKAGKYGQFTNMTISEIAHKLQMTPSTKLRIMANEMVLDGLLLSEKETYPGLTGFRVLYRLPGKNVLEHLRAAETDAYGKKRHIRINTAQGSFLEEMS